MTNKTLTREQQIAAGKRLGRKPPLETRQATALLTCECACVAACTLSTLGRTVR